MLPDGLYILYIGLNAFYKLCMWECLTTAPRVVSFLHLCLNALCLCFDLPCRNCVIAFDHIQAPHYKVLHLDLCTVEDQILLCTLIRTLRPSVVWLAPPCGTASKAKDIPPAFEQAGRPISLPLRSTEFPDGLPGLSSSQWSRVLAANELHVFVSTIVHLCEDLRIPWVIGNPANSYMWLTSPLQSLPSFSSVRFRNCMQDSNWRSYCITAWTSPLYISFATSLTNTFLGKYKAVLIQWTYSKP